MTPRALVMVAVLSALSVPAVSRAQQAPPLRQTPPWMKSWIGAFGRSVR